MSDRTPDMRASDAERERAVEILNEAAGCGRLSVEELEERLQAVYRSVTRNELALLIADVSADRIGALTLASARARSAVTVREGSGGTRWVVSIMGSNDRSGTWRIGRRCTVLNVMGGGNLDLCDAELSHHETKLNVFSLMGGGEIRVPDGVHVRVSKLALMGGNDVRVGAQVPARDAPVIHIRLASIMGGCTVRRGRKRSRAQRRRDRELDRGI